LGAATRMRSPGRERPWRRGRRNGPRGGGPRGVKVRRGGGSEGALEDLPQGTRKARRKRKLVASARRFLVCPFFFFFAFLSARNKVWRRKHGFGPRPRRSERCRSLRCGPRRTRRGRGPSGMKAPHRTKYVPRNRFQSYPADEHRPDGTGRSRKWNSRQTATTKLAADGVAVNQVWLRPLGHGPLAPGGLRTRPQMDQQPTHPALLGKLAGGEFHGARLGAEGPARLILTKRWRIGSIDDR